MRRILAVIAAAWMGALAACESTPETSYVERSVSVIYNEAMDKLAAENYLTAAELFDEVERQHPYSYWATKGQLMAAFARYKKNEYDEALIGLDRFIQLHPGSPDVPYAYYLKALCYYERVKDVSRDQKNTKMALESFEELTVRFADSKYTENAEPKIKLLTDHLAGKEMTIGRYYQKREHYLAAINRFRAVVEEYETTVHVTEALHRLVESYLALGMTEGARKTAAILGYNFPNSDWYWDTYGLLEENDLLREHETFKENIKRHARLSKAQGEAGEEEEKSFFSRAWDWVF